MTRLRFAIGGLAALLLATLAFAGAILPVCTTTSGCTFPATFTFTVTGGSTLNLTTGAGVSGMNFINESTNQNTTRIWNVIGTLTSSNGVQVGGGCEPTITQTGTAGFVACLDNLVAENSTGSGVHLIHDFEVAGVSKASIDDGGVIKASAYAAIGSVPTLTGTCTTSTQVGGNTAGSFAATCTAQTVIITFAFTAPNGWVCNAQDITTVADTMKQTASGTASCTLSGTTVASDVIVFDARAF